MSKHVKFAKKIGGYRPRLGHRGPRKFDQFWRNVISAFICLFPANLRMDSKIVWIIFTSNDFGVWVMKNLEVFGYFLYEITVKNRRKNDDSRISLCLIYESNKNEGLPA